MLTQIVRYGRMLKANFGDIRCEVTAHWTSDGSVFAGTITSKCHSIEITTEIESEDDPALIAAVVRNAEGGCYAEAALKEPVPLFKNVTLNGEAFDYEAYPRRVKRR